MLPYFVSYEYLAVAQTTTTSDVFFRFSLEWPNDALFGKEMTVGLGLSLFCDALSCWDMDVYLSVHLKPWNRCTCTSLSDGFQFLLVKRVPKYVWRWTSAALNYTNVSMVTKWSWSRYLLPFHSQTSFQVYLNYSTMVWSQVTITGRFMHILVWMLLQDISDRIRLSRTVQRTYFIIYGFCFTCFTVEYKRWYMYISKALPMKQ